MRLQYQAGAAVVLTGECGLSVERKERDTTGGASIDLGVAQHCLLKLPLLQNLSRGITIQADLLRELHQVV